MTYINDEDFKEEYVQPRRLGYAKNNGQGGIIFRRTYKEGFKELHAYKPTYNEDTQYLEFVDYGECTKYMLYVYVVRDYQIEEPEEDTTI